MFIVYDFKTDRKVATFNDKSQANAMARILGYETFDHPVRGKLLRYAVIPA
jgi:hypothetical protein